MIGLGLSIPEAAVRRAGGYDPIVALGASLLGYWDAAYPDSLTLDGGGEVSSWRDLTAGYDAVQATGSAMPVHQATGFGGDPAVTFDGLDDCLACTDGALLGSLPLDDAAGEIWYLIEQAAPGSDAVTRAAASYSGANAASTGRQAGRSVAGGVNRAFGRAGPTIVNDTLIDLSTRHVLRLRVTGSAVALSVDDDAPLTTAAVPATAASRLRIGASSSSGPSAFWQGRIAALLITTLLTEPQADALQGWLMARRKL